MPSPIMRQQNQLTTKEIKTYAIFLLLCVAGWIWLYINYATNEALHSICFFKEVTGIACPSCGTSRSILALLHGDVLKSILINPLGLIATLVLVVFPLWFCFDFLLKRKTFYSVYSKAEQLLKNPKIYIPLIVLILLNWIWNIVKGL